MKYLFSNDTLIKNFLNHLQCQGKSKVSIKNYKSDIGHFLAWAILKLKSFGSYADTLAEILPFIDQNFFNEYKSYMTENKLKIKTVNRRLSSLRSFSSFLYSSNLISQDFMRGIQNVGIGLGESPRLIDTEIVEKFRQALEKERVSDNTVKNYLSDVRSFLAWYNKKGALPNEV